MRSLNLYYYRDLVLVPVAARDGAVFRDHSATLCTLLMVFIKEVATGEPPVVRVRIPRKMRSNNYIYAVPYACYLLQLIVCYVQCSTLCCVPRAARYAVCHVQHAMLCATCSTLCCVARLHITDTIVQIPLRSRL